MTWHYLSIQKLRRKSEEVYNSTFKVNQEVNKGLPYKILFTIWRQFIEPYFTDAVKKEISQIRIENVKSTGTDAVDYNK